MAMESDIAEAHRHSRLAPALSAWLRPSRTLRATLNALLENAAGEKESTTVKGEMRAIP
jgi:hypothetical protein